ncbi:MAG: alpha-glucan family phosphorylase [Candidatus Omnitrophica bacterium]|nr:alpha-glucan family phosphorylase [Candidatus Omnitrophota bacterium]
MAELEGANVRNVIRGLGKDPVVGEMYLDPGLGYGGDQLPSATEYFMRTERSERMRGKWFRYRRAREEIRDEYKFQKPAGEVQFPLPYVTSVNEVNYGQVALHVAKIREAAGGSLQGKKVAVLGLAYRPDTHSIEHAPSTELIRTLLEEGAVIRATDENPTAIYNAQRRINGSHRHPTSGGTVQFVEKTQEALQNAEVAVLVTGWAPYADWQKLFTKQGEGREVIVPHVVDGRHFYPMDAIVGMRRAGIDYSAVGIPQPARSETRAEEIQTRLAELATQEAALREQLDGLRAKMRTGSRYAHESQRIEVVALNQQLRALDEEKTKLETEADSLVAGRSEMRALDVLIPVIAQAGQPADEIKMTEIAEGLFYAVLIAMVALTALKTLGVRWRAAGAEDIRRKYETIGKSIDSDLAAGKDPRKGSDERLRQLLAAGDQFQPFYQMDVAGEISTLDEQVKSETYMVLEGVFKSFLSVLEFRAVRIKPGTFFESESSRRFYGLLRALKESLKNPELIDIALPRLKRLARKLNAVPEDKIARAAGTAVQSAVSELEKRQAELRLSAHADRSEVRVPTSGEEEKLAQLHVETRRVYEVRSEEALRIAVSSIMRPVIHAGRKVVSILFARSKLEQVVGKGSHSLAMLQPHRGDGQLELDLGTEIDMRDGGVISDQVALAIITGRLNGAIVYPMKVQLRQDDELSSQYQIVVSRSEVRDGVIKGTVKTGGEIVSAILGTRAAKAAIGFATVIVLLWVFFPLRLYIAPEATRANLMAAAEKANISIVDRTANRYLENPHFYKGLARAVIDTPLHRTSQIRSITLVDEKPAKDEEPSLRVVIDLKHGEIPNPPFAVSKVHFRAQEGKDPYEMARLPDVIAMQDSIFGGAYKNHEQTKGIFGMLPNLLVWLISAGVSVLTLVMWFSRDEPPPTHKAKKLPRQKTIDSQTWHQGGSFRSEVRRTAQAETEHAQRDAAEPVIEALGRVAKNKPWQIAGALGLFERKQLRRVFPVLVEVLREKEHPQHFRHRFIQAQILKSLPVLINILKLNVNQTLNIAIEVLEDKSYGTQVRVTAAEVLGEMLVQYRRKIKANVRKQAVRTLRRVVKDRHSELIGLGEQSKVSRAAAEALGEIGPVLPQIVSSLNAALQDNRPQVRIAALQALNDWGPRAVTDLSKVIRVVRPNKMRSFQERLLAVDIIEAQEPAVAVKALPALRGLRVHLRQSPSYIANYRMLKENVEHAIQRLEPFEQRSSGTHPIEARSEMRAGLNHEQIVHRLQQIRQGRMLFFTYREASGTQISMSMPYRSFRVENDRNIVVESTLNLVSTWDLDHMTITHIEDFMGDGEIRSTLAALRPGQEMTIDYRPQYDADPAHNQQFSAVFTGFEEKDNGFVLHFADGVASRILGSDHVIAIRSGKIQEGAAAAAVLVAEPPSPPDLSTLPHIGMAGIFAETLFNENPDWLASVPGLTREGFCRTVERFYAVLYQAGMDMPAMIGDELYGAALKVEGITEEMLTLQRVYDVPLRVQVQTAEQFYEGILLKAVRRAREFSEIAARIETQKSRMTGQDDSYRQISQDDLDDAAIIRMVYQDVYAAPRTDLAGKLDKVTEQVDAQFLEFEATVTKRLLQLRLFGIARPQIRFDLVQKAIAGSDMRNNLSSVLLSYVLGEQFMFNLYRLGENNVQLLDQFMRMSLDPVIAARLRNHPLIRELNIEVTDDLVKAAREALGRLHYKAAVDYPTAVYLLDQALEVFGPELRARSKTPIEVFRRVTEWDEGKSRYWESLTHFSLVAAQDVPENLAGDLAAAYPMPEGAGPLMVPLRQALTTRNFVVGMAPRVLAVRRAFQYATSNVAQGKLNPAEAVERVTGYDLRKTVPGDFYPLQRLHEFLDPIVAQAIAVDIFTSLFGMQGLVPVEFVQSVQETGQLLEQTGLDYPEIGYAFQRACEAAVRSGRSSIPELIEAIRAVPEADSFIREVRAAGNALRVATNRRIAEYLTRNNEWLAPYLGDFESAFLPAVHSAMGILADYGVNDPAACAIMMDSLLNHAKPGIESGAVRPEEVVTDWIDGSHLARSETRRDAMTERSSGTHPIEARSEMRAAGAEVFDALRTRFRDADVGLTEDDWRLVEMELSNAQFAQLRQDVYFMMISEPSPAREVFQERDEALARIGQLRDTLYGPESTDRSETRRDATTERSSGTHPIEVRAEMRLPPPDSAERDDMLIPLGVAKNKKLTELEQQGYTGLGVELIENLYATAARLHSMASRTGDSTYATAFRSYVQSVADPLLHLDAYELVFRLGAKRAFTLRVLMALIEDQAGLEPEKMEREIVLTEVGKVLKDMEPLRQVRDFSLDPRLPFVAELRPGELFSEEIQSKLRKASDLILSSGWLAVHPKTFYYLPSDELDQKFLQESSPTAIAVEIVKSALISEVAYDSRIPDIAISEGDQPGSVPRFRNPWTGSSGNVPSELLAVLRGHWAESAFVLVLRDSGQLDALEGAQLLSTVHESLSHADEVIADLRKNEAKLSSEFLDWLTVMEHRWDELHRQFTHRSESGNGQGDEETDPYEMPLPSPFDFSVVDESMRRMGKLLGATSTWADVTTGIIAYARAHRRGTEPFIIVVRYGGTKKGEDLGLVVAEDYRIKADEEALTNISGILSEYIDQLRRVASAEHDLILTPYSYAAYTYELHDAGIVPLTYPLGESKQVIQSRVLVVNLVRSEVRREQTPSPETTIASPDAVAAEKEKLSPLQQLAKRHGPLRIGFVAARAGSSDGVSREMEKWAYVLQRAGHQVFGLVAEGEFQLDGVETERLPEVARLDHEDNQQVLAAAFPNLTATQSYTRLDEIRRQGVMTEVPVLELIEADSEEVKKRIVEWAEEKKIDVLIFENTMTLPDQIALGVGSHKVIEALQTPVILHHHEVDYKERPAYQGAAGFIRPYLKTGFPPKTPGVVHSLLSKYAREVFSQELEAQDPSLTETLTVIHDAADFAQGPARIDEYNQDLREALGLEPDDVIIVHPARMLARKGLELSLQLLGHIDNPKVKLVIMDDDDDFDESYRESINEYIDTLSKKKHFGPGFKKRIIFMGNHPKVKLGLRRGQTNGRKIYTDEDVYAHAALASVPSFQEGFAGKLIDVVRARLQVVTYSHAVLQTEFEMELLGENGYRFKFFPNIPLPSLTPEIVRRNISMPVYQDKMKALAHEVANLLANQGQRNQDTEHNSKKLEPYFSFEYLDRHLRNALEEAIALRAAVKDPVVNRFARFKGVQLLNHLVELNRLINDSETPRQTVIALRVLRRKKYAPAVHRAIEGLSNNLMCELPEQVALMKAVAESVGIAKDFEARDYLMKPVMREVTKREAWAQVARDNRVVELLLNVVKNYRKYLEEHKPDPNRPLVAYFSAGMGFKSTKGYSGGLEILAGDTVRGASDANLNYVAVALIYERGYFRQAIHIDGSQGELDEKIDPKDLPLMEAGPDGRELIIDIPLPGKVVKAKVWKALYGNTPVFFLDTNIPANKPEDRRITGKIYRNRNGTWERQEQYEVLSEGGKIALDTLGLRPKVVHINDNHPSLVAAKLIHDTMLEIPAEIVQQAMAEIPPDSGMTEENVRFEMALWKCTPQIVFTTHTPVLAGNEAVPLNTMQEFLKAIFAGDQYAIERVMSLGKVCTVFNLTVFTMRVSEFHNAVSWLHAHVSRRMWQHLFPGVAVDDVPIVDIVNSVHVPYWQAPEITDLFAGIFQKPEVAALMDGRYEDLMERLRDDAWVDEHIDVDDEAYWQVHLEIKRRLKNEMLRRMRERVARNDATTEDLAYVNSFDENAILIGWGRRFAGYKRPKLLFDDLDKLEAIATAAGKPIQIIVAGKAHPADTDVGQRLIKELHELIKQLRARGVEVKAVFVENYDIELARLIDAGVDIWINSPVRPREASGTSGEKVLLNGGQNMSTLDGWTVEGIEDGVNGFTYGVHQDERHDLADRESLYYKLEEAVRLFYENPKEWRRRMKKAVVSGVHKFGMKRMMASYDERLYQPAAAAAEMSWEEVMRKAVEGLKKRYQMLKQSTGELKPEVVSVTHGEYAARGKPVRIEAEVDLQQSSLDDFAVDVSIEYEEKPNVDGEERKPVLWGKLERVQSLKQQGKYRCTFSVAPEYEGRYKIVVRIAPRRQNIWKAGTNFDELESVTTYKDSATMLQVWDANLLQYRVGADDEGMLFYIRIPPETRVQPGNVFWTSLATKWDQEPLVMDLVPGTDDLYAIVVPKEQAPPGDYGFKFLVRFQDGRKAWLTGHYDTRMGNAWMLIQKNNPLYLRVEAKKILATLKPMLPIVAPPTGPVSAPAVSAVPTEISAADVRQLLYVEQGGPGRQKDDGFYWTKEARSEMRQVAEHSEPGFLGFIEGFRRLRQRSLEELKATLAFHAQNISAEKPAGDIFYYLLNTILQDARHSLSPLKTKVEHLAHLTATTGNVDEKVSYSMQALEIAEALCLQLAWQSLVEYAQGKDEAVRAFQHPVNGKLLKKNLVLYLDQKAQDPDSVIQEGETTAAREHIRAYTVPLSEFDPQSDTERKALVLINVGNQPRIRGKREGVFDSMMTHVRAKTIREVLPAKMTGDSGSSGRKFFAQWVSLPSEMSQGKGHGVLDQRDVETIVREGVDIYIPGASEEGANPLDLEVVRCDDAEPAMLARYVEAAIKRIDATDSDGNVLEAHPEQLIREEIEKTLDPGGVVTERTRDLLKEIIAMGIPMLETQFGKDSIPAVMAAIAMLAPELLDLMKDWKDWNEKQYEDQYKALSAMMSRPGDQELFRNGTVQFHAASPDTGIVVSKSHEGRKIFFAVHFARIEEKHWDADHKIGFTVTEVDSLELDASEPLQYQVRDKMIDWLYHRPHTVASLNAGGGWHIRVPGKTRFQFVEWESAQLSVAEIKHDNLILAVNLTDLAIEINGKKVMTVNSIGKLREILNFIAVHGIGKIYIYGGLYQMSGLGKKIHTVPSGRRRHLRSDNGRVTVETHGYITKRNIVDVNGHEVTIQDDGNPFSYVLSEDGLPALNPELFLPDQITGTTDAEKENAKRRIIAELFKEIHALGMEVIVDFIPRLSPDAINEKNYKWTFYKELTEEQRAEYESYGDDETSKQDFINELLNAPENGPFCAVRIKENGVERVILVRNENGGVNRDQVVLNPFVPEVRKFYLDWLKFLIDLGADGVRCDLPGWLMNTDQLKNNFTAETPGSIPYNQDDELWKFLIREATTYARAKYDREKLPKAKEFQFIMEAYAAFGERERLWQVARSAFEDGIVGATRALNSVSFYYRESFEAHYHYEKRKSGTAQSVDGTWKVAFDESVVNKRIQYVAAATNYDEMTTKAIGGNRRGTLMKEFALANAGMHAMVGLSDMIEVDPLATIPGGKIHPGTRQPRPEPGDNLQEWESAHSWEFDPEKIADRATWAGDGQRPGLKKIIERGDGFQLLAAFNRSLRSRGQDRMDFHIGSNDRDQVSVMAFREPERGEWTMLVTDHALEGGRENDRLVDLPSPVETANYHVYEVYLGADGQERKVEAQLVEQRQIKVHFGPGPDNGVKIIRFELKNRSELRSAVDGALRELAVQGRISTDRAEALVEVVSDPDVVFDQVASTILGVAVQPDVMDSFLIRNTLGAGATISAEMAQIASEENLDAAETFMRKYLAMDAENHLNFAWAMSVPEDANVQAWITGFLNRVAKVAAEHGNDPKKISAKVSLLVAQDKMAECNRMMDRVANKQMVQIIDASSVLNVKTGLDEFLEQNPNALILDLPNAFKGCLAPGDERRNVLLKDLTQPQAFPVFAVMNFITAQENTAVSAELLRQISEFFTQRVVRYDGNHLIVLVSARDFALENSIATLVARMA